MHLKRDEPKHMVDYDSFDKILFQFPSLNLSNEYCYQWLSQDFILKRILFFIA